MYDRARMLEQCEKQYLEAAFTHGDRSKGEGAKKNDRSNQQRPSRRQSRSSSGQDSRDTGGQRSQHSGSSSASVV